METFEPIEDGSYPLTKEEAISLVEYGIHLQNSTEAKIKKHNQEGAGYEME